MRMTDLLDSEDSRADKTVIIAKHKIILPMIDIR